MRQTRLTSKHLASPSPRCVFFTKSSSASGIREPGENNGGKQSRAGPSSKAGPKLSSSLSLSFAARKRKSWAREAAGPNGLLGVWSSKDRLSIRKTSNQFPDQDVVFHRSQEFARKSDKRVGTHRDRTLPTPPLRPQYIPYRTFSRELEPLWPTGFPKKPINSTGFPRHRALGVLMDQDHQPKEPSPGPNHIQATNPTPPS